MHLFAKLYYIIMQFMEIINKINKVLKNTQHCPMCLIMGGTILDKVTS